MIQVENLTKLYGSVAAVDNLSFQVNKGEILGFLGPNGAGKTTTMRILTGYYPPSKGHAAVAGYDIEKHSLEVRKRVGYLPESVPIYTDQTVKSYLNFVADMKKVHGSDKKTQVGEVLEKCGLVSVQKRIIKNLSKGYRQRVGIAQALVGKPQVLILDEPTVGLDPNQIIEIRDLIKSLEGNCTIILSTHILSEVQMTCQRVLILNKGKMVAMDSPKNLQKRIHESPEILLRVTNRIITEVNQIDGKE